MQISWSVSHYHEASRPYKVNVHLFDTLQQGDELVVACFSATLSAFLGVLGAILGQ